MRIKKIDNNSFGSKNTFLQKSEKALTKAQKGYFLSLHYEAMARMHYLKFQKAEKDLANAKSNFDLIKTFCKMVREKWQSFVYTTNSYKEFPKRFEEPDNYSSQSFRHCKLKDTVNIK